MLQRGPHDRERHRLRPWGEEPALQRRRLRPQRPRRAVRGPRDLRHVRGALHRLSARHHEHGGGRYVHPQRRPLGHERPARHPDRQVASPDHDPDDHQLRRQPAHQRRSDPFAEEPHRGGSSEDGCLHRRLRLARVPLAAHRRRSGGVHIRGGRRARAHLPGDRRQRRRRRITGEPDGALGLRGRPRDVRHRDPLVRRGRAPGDQARDVVGGAGGVRKRRGGASSRRTSTTTGSKGPALRRTSRAPRRGTRGRTTSGRGRTTRRAARSTRASRRGSRSSSG